MVEQSIEILRDQTDEFWVNHITENRLSRQSLVVEFSSSLSIFFRYYGFFETSKSNH